MAHTRKKLLIVDGYNVLRSGSRYKRMLAAVNQPDYTDDAFNAAREALINDVIGFAGRDTRAIIVFDGGRNNYSQGTPETIGGVQIIFSPYGQSADHVIEKLAFDARERMVEVLVVSSDASIQETVFSGSVTRMSAEGFSLEIERGYAQVDIDDTLPRARKSTIADRISPESLAKLKALRDTK